MSRSDLTRLSVNLNPETAEALKAVVGAQGISYAEGIRAADGTASNARRPND